MRFKEYIQNKQELFSYTFDDFIPQNAPGRIVNSIVDNLERMYSELPGKVSDTAGLYYRR